MRTSESMGHQQRYGSSAPFEPEVRKRTCSNMCANFGFGALARSGVLRFAVAERPVLLLHLDQIDENVLAPQAGTGRKTLGDALEQLLLLLEGAGVIRGDLDEDQVARIGNSEIARRTHDPDS